ncbi:rhodanese-related sulfurtransferase [Pseudomonas corrugata]|nr:rhodanese-related sulfurtransferase [Pseudomonas corrugata]
MKTVTAAQVEQWAIDAGRSLFLCDVRTVEEFAAASLPGAQHTPGGQLIQSTDLYVGVRKARLVLIDSDGVRAPIVASWLRQLGHEVYVLEGGVSSGLALPAGEVIGHEALPSITAQALSDALKDEAVALIDLRPSMTYRKGHIAGSRWSIRSLLAQHVAGEQRPLVLLADDAQLATFATQELPEDQRAQVRLLGGGLGAWRAAGFAVQ